MDQEEWFKGEYCDFPYWKNILENNVPIPKPDDIFLMSCTKHDVMLEQNTGFSLGNIPQYYLIQQFINEQFTAVAAKLLQLCPTLCDPTDGGPPGSSVHGILQARALE